MKFINIKNINKGRFITRYDITYKTKDNQEKVYEMISRNKNITSLEDLHSNKADSVVIIMTNKENNKILLNKEFRLAVGELVYNFPAGLIDKGEIPEESAKRELKEETGLDILEIKNILIESYSAVGFSNEKNITVIGVAGGEISPSNSSYEEIEAGWYSKEEIRKMLKKDIFSGKAQAYCYLWSKE